MAESRPPRRHRWPGWLALCGYAAIGLAAAAAFVVLTALLTGRSDASTPRPVGTSPVEVGSVAVTVDPGSRPSVR